MEAFREGFQSVVSLDNLVMFQSEELDLLFCGGQVQLHMFLEGMSPIASFLLTYSVICELLGIIAEVLFNNEDR